MIRKLILDNKDLFLFPASIAVFSAGSLPVDAVHPMAINVMKKAGTDISGQQPKRLTDIPLEKVDMGMKTEKA